MKASPPSAFSPTPSWSRLPDFCSFLLLITCCLAASVNPVASTSRLLARNIIERQPQQHRSAASAKGSVSEMEAMARQLKSTDERLRQLPQHWNDNSAIISGRSASTVDHREPEILLLGRMMEALQVQKSRVLTGGEADESRSTRLLHNVPNGPNPISNDLPSGYSKTLRTPPAFHRHKH